ncbi:MAG: hypothetical protein JNK58_03875 [Phycisphaerae bacterium]|nr:hypothetical protein [Phycisphaerae bacterium]
MTLFAANSIGTLSRALFLACSWTWCIGMWFPVYMVNDWGWPGWAAFLVPNAVGAALVGCLHTSRSSPAFVAANRSAMRAFSVVTILFHVSWLTWLLSLLFSRSFIGQGWIGGATAAGTVAAGVLLSLGKRWTIPAVVVYAISLLAAFWSWRTGSTLRVPPDAGEQPLTGLVYAAPMLVLGFGLCPHLDLTFHRVRQEAAGWAGVAAFGLAFGLLFPILMVYTLLYAGGFRDGSWSLYLWAHFTAQAAFTIGAHLRELRPGGIAEWGPRWPVRRAQVLLAVVLMFASAALPWAPGYKEGVPATRLVYELFMSFYALVFPAYVWIVAVERGVPRSVRLRAWAATCVLAAPFMWVGYIERQYVWLLPAVGIVLVAPVAVKAFAHALDRG